MNKLGEEAEERLGDEDVRFEECPRDLVRKIINAYDRASRRARHKARWFIQSGGKQRLEEARFSEIVALTLESIIQCIPHAEDCRCISCGERHIGDRELELPDEGEKRREYVDSWARETR